MDKEIGGIPFRLMDGSESTLSAWRGKVVLGFPANDFGAQEPGSNEEIAAFCSARYQVAFPLAQKLSVKGPERHPLYAALTASQPRAEDPAGGAMRAKLEGYGFRQDDPADVLWNFEKFLVGRDGRVAARFNPDVAPDDPQLLAAIDRELARET